MDLRQLRYFLALAEERHFTRAAVRLGIAQPALSQQIRRLEAEIGLALVERTTRKVVVTDAGVVLARHARALLRQAEEAEDAMRALRGMTSGRVVLGVTRTPGAVDVVGVLARYTNEHPGVDLDVREDLSVGLAAKLEADELDLALVTVHPGPAYPRLEIGELAVEALVLVTATGHRLAARDEVTIDDLRGEPVAMFHRGATIRELLEERAADAGFSLRISFELADAARARALVGHGLAVGVLPASDAALPGPEIAAVPFGGGGFEHRTAVAVRRGRQLAPAVRAFRDLLHDEVRRG